MALPVGTVGAVAENLAQIMPHLADCGGWFVKD